jgi:lysylphosphatidylglycerol synthetase-like protein (DUF2156 family)
LAPRSGGIAAQLPHDPSASRPRKRRGRFGRDDEAKVKAAGISRRSGRLSREIERSHTRLAATTASLVVAVLVFVAALATGAGAILVAFLIVVLACVLTSPGGRARAATFVGADERRRTWRTRWERFCG